MNAQKKIEYALSQIMSEELRKTDDRAEMGGKLIEISNSFKENNVFSKEDKKASSSLSFGARKFLSLS